MMQVRRFLTKTKSFKSNIPIQRSFFKTISSLEPQKQDKSKEIISGFSTDIVNPSKVEYVDMSKYETGFHSPLTSMNILSYLALSKLHRAPSRIFSSSVLGGAMLSFGCMLYLTVAAAVSGPAGLLVGALFFPIGLLTIIATGSDLLTGNFMYAALPFNAKKAGLKPLSLLKGTFDQVTYRDVARLFAVSGIGNLVGSVAMAAVALAVMPSAFPWAGVVMSLATKKCALGFGTAFLKGILANWLVNLAIYMSTVSQNSMGKIMSIWIPISAFVALGFEHSIANMFLIPLGIMCGADLSFMGDFFLHNLVPVTLGNAVGGALCVGTWHAYVSGIYDPKIPFKAEKITQVIKEENTEETDKSKL